MEDQVYASRGGQQGISSHSLSKAYGTLGITGANRRRAIGNDVEAAEKASRWLWLKRGEAGV